MIMTIMGKRATICQHIAINAQTIKISGKLKSGQSNRVIALMMIAHATTCAHRLKRSP